MNRFIIERCGYLCASLLITLMTFSNPVLSDQTEVVRIWTRSDYFPENLLDEFERRTGITAIHEVYESNEDGAVDIYRGTSPYDLILPPLSFLTQLIEVGSVQRIDHGKIKATHNLGRGVVRLMVSFSPDKERPLRLYGVPLLFGFTGIGYDIGEAAIRIPGSKIDSLRYLFDPEVLRNFAECGVGFVDAPGEVIRSALLYLGEDPNSDDPAVLAKAESVLMAIRPYIKKFYTDDLMKDLAEGRICLAMGWSGDVLRAHVEARDLDTHRQIGFSIPKEGSPVWIDAFAIPTNATNADNAYAFINFLSEARVAAQVARYTLFPSVNVEATAIGWDEDLFDNPQIFPKWEIIDNQFMVPAHNAATLELIGRMWDRIKASAE